MQSLRSYVRVLAMVIATAGLAIAGSHSGLKSRTFGNNYMGIKGTGSYLLTNSATSPSYARQMAVASFSFLDVVNIPIADARMSAYSNTGGSATVKLLGTTVWSKKIPIGPTAHMVSPDLTKSIFGSKPPSLTVSLGPFDVTLQGNAGVGAKQDFYHHVVSSMKGVELNGYARVWAYASGTISVSCWVAAIGITLTENFAKTKMDGDLDVDATSFGDAAHVKFSSSCLELVLWVELLWIDVYEETLVDHCTDAATYNVW